MCGITWWPSCETGPCWPCATKIGATPRARSSCATRRSSAASSTCTCHSGWRPTCPATRRTPSHPRSSASTLTATGSPLHRRHAQGRCRVRRPLDRTHHRRSPDQLSGRELHWGTQIDVKVARTGLPGESLAEQHVAGHLAKYAAKVTEITGVSAGRVTAANVEAYADPHRHTIRLIRACGDLSAVDGWIGLRRWAHMLGFGGHFATKSRRDSTTMGALRAAPRPRPPRGHRPRHRTRRSRGLGRRRRRHDRARHQPLAARRQRLATPRSPPWLPTPHATGAPSELPSAPRHPI
ncbi:replication initiator [Catellatospora sp. NPDC049609]|uniref:replication initiator n=1 Tax=Catellatospora sp. NPDC049609 TaxID=3155505 RepID=UPI00342A212B